MSRREPRRARASWRVVANEVIAWLIVILAALRLVSYWVGGDDMDLVVGLLWIVLLYVGSHE